MFIKIGVWDIYQQPTAKQSRLWPWPTVLLQSLPYVARMLTDMANIPEVRILLLAFLAVQLANALVPACSLYYSGKLLAIVQTAVEHRTVDSRVLVQVAVANFLCSIATRVLRYAKQGITIPLHVRVKRYYSVHIFHAMSRLDLPTFDDPAVQRQLEGALPNHARSTIAFDAISASLRVLTTALQLVSQFFVLLSVIKHQPDGSVLATIALAQSFFLRASPVMPFLQQGIWVATTTDTDYIRSEGLKRTITNPAHRKEIVASGIGPYLLAEFRTAVSRVGDRAADFYEAVSSTQSLRDAFDFSVCLSELLSALPHIIFALRAVQQPASIPLSLASLHLITNTTESFTFTLFHLYNDAGYITEKLAAVRLLYEIVKIPNKVKVETSAKEADQDDPTLGVPFPEDQRSLDHGISVEFRAVSFKYPDSDTYALRNVNFTITQGQLCVIVGNNGSGKSTILKLIARLYDPTEGHIFINGIDIKTIRLADLRRAISVLFQDYTLFPLSIRDNISLGDPPHASDLSKIQQAAQLGGADTFIERLPEKYDTYLERPVQDYYSSLPEGTTSIDGRPIDFAHLRQAAGGLDASGSKGLSGGQMQRIALSRTFMRSVVSEATVGLLLFDEPSASLDPTAEHDLFERLRKLRGNKTMIFSSHRFGNLTRHADLILYMNDSVVEEEGTHDDLLRKQGEYARIWMLQARAFL